MRYRLPSLNALRAFEAAARLGSISSAAKEGNVSPGAVSRHVGLLEKYFDCQLLERESRGVALTQRGESFFKTVSIAFEMLDLASEKLHAGYINTTVSIRAHTTFASEWLLPRLDRFRLSHPEIDLRVDVSLKPINFQSDQIDIGLVRSDHAPPGVDCHILFRPMFFPVASKDYLAASDPLIKPSDLVRCRLLVSQIQKQSWRKWFELIGVPEIDLDQGVHFENSSLAFKAARQGVGIALGQRLFVAEDISKGILEAPFPIGLDSNHTYALAVLRRRLHDPSVIAFRDWIIEEVREAENQAADVFQEFEVSAFG